MLPKRSRLTAKEVRAILKGGRSVRLQTVSAKYMPSRTSKAAVVVSSKTAKKAVERNRIRRAAWLALPALPGGIHAVFFINTKDFIPAELASLCSKLSS